MEKLIIFGDSIMRGVLLDEGKYICPSEERRAREETTGLEIESCCKFGATIDKAQTIIHHPAPYCQRWASCALSRGIRRERQRF